MRSGELQNAARSLGFLRLMIVDILAKVEQRKSRRSPRTSPAKGRLHYSPRLFVVGVVENSDGAGAEVKSEDFLGRNRRSQW